MKFFIDTANLDQIREAHDLGVLDPTSSNNPSMTHTTVSWASIRNTARIPAVG